MMRYSSLEIPSLLLFIGIFNLFILLFIVVISGMDGNFPLACPCAIPSICSMANESMPWYSQSKEEKY